MTWYRSADKKAQVILSIDGAFLAFLTGSMFSEPGELGAMTAEFSAATWLLLLLMTITLSGSIFSALACLWSRIYSRTRILSVDETFEVGTLAFQIRALSRNVARKHLWVNAGFLLAACSLILFLAAGVSHVIGV